MLAACRSWWIPHARFHTNVPAAGNEFFADSFTTAADKAH